MFRLAFSIGSIGRIVIFLSVMQPNLKKKYNESAI
jgi:hypothetical protein